MGLTPWANCYSQRPPFPPIWQVRHHAVNCLRTAGVRGSNPLTSTRRTCGLTSVFATSDRGSQTHLSLPLQSPIPGVFQTFERRRLVARRSPSEESIAAIPDPIIAPTVTSPG